MLLRCTTRLLKLLGTRQLILVDDPPGDDDWYANLLWIDRHKCLLLTHAGTLFPIFVADVRKPDLHPPGPFIVARSTPPSPTSSSPPTYSGRSTPT